MNTKVCARCKQEKSLQEFYHLKKSKDGLSYQCKVCKNILTIEWRTKNREHFQKYRKKYFVEYYKANKKALCDKAKKYKLKNIDKTKENNRLYQRKWREHNKERDLQIHQAYRLRNREQINERQRKRRAVGFPNPIEMQKARERSRQWFKDNKERAYIASRKWQSNDRNKLGDTYIKTLLLQGSGLKFIEIPNEVTKIKRLQIQLIREGKKQ